MMRAEDLEHLAIAIHEAGREAVARHLVVNDLGKPFLEWVDISEAGREGRRVMARALASNPDWVIRWVGP